MLPSPLSKKSGNNWIREYYNFDIAKLEKDLVKKKEASWQKDGAKRALEIFHAAAARVPAYKHFLKKNKINPGKVITAADFSLVPVTDKKNYIEAYPLNLRSWDGQPEKGKLIATSSGTTGQSHYWPREGYQEFEAAITHELIYKTFFNVDKLSSLVVIGFPMGVYVSGMATALPTWLVAQKYPMGVVNVGNNKLEALKAIKNLHKFYKQVIFIGHPFFIKDVLESGKAAGINWKKMNLRLMFCSEGFNEIWREHLMLEAGIKNKSGGALSTYGSSEMLLMAYETPLSLALKEMAEKNPAFSNKFFGSPVPPSVFQYNPTLRYIEQVKRELVFTSLSGAPLIRFNLHDTGAVIDFPRALGDAKAINKNYPLWKLPLLALWGRSDHTLIFYAANIYPEHVRLSLHTKELLSRLTGKFTMRKGYYKNMDEFLEINLELRPGIKPGGLLNRKAQSSIFSRLLQLNSEFADAHSRFGKKAVPIVKLWPYNHAKYFKPGLKPKFIFKD